MFIVDDNPWDRKGIAALIDYRKLGINRILTFEDGEEAFGALEGAVPDIVLTDVAMPRLNGLQLAEKLRPAYPDTKVIFMSCYSEFEYIKSALDMNSAGYILKPVETAELFQVLEKTVNAIIRERDNQRMISRFSDKTGGKKLREQFIMEFIFDSAGEEAALKERFAGYGLGLPERFGICLVSVAADRDVVEAKSGTPDPARYALYSELEKVFGEIAGEREGTVIISTSLTEYVMFCVLNLTLRAPDAFPSGAIYMLQKLPDQFLFHISAGVSMVSGRLSDASNLYQQSIQAKENVFFDGSRLMIYSEGSEYPKDVKGRLSEPNIGKNLYADLKKLLSTGSEKELQTFLDKYISRTNAWQNELYMKNIAFMIIALTRFILQAEDARTFGDSQVYGFEEDWRELDAIRTMTDLTGYLRESVLLDMRGLSQGAVSRKTVIAGRVKESIRTHYGSRLTVKDIAAEVNFSSIYINNVFKQATGKTIFEYLTQVRMEAAMELLKKPDSKIYIVADEVGFTNKSHFCLVFKRYTGLSPSEYKSRVKF